MTSELRLSGNLRSSDCNTKRKKKWSLVLSHLFLSISLIFVLFPLIFVYLTSFRNTGSLYSTSIFPQKLTWANYAYLFSRTDFLLWVKNSMILAIISGLAAILLTSSAAYVFSRIKFRGRRAGLITLVILQMFPAVMGMVAIYNLLTKIHLINTFTGLILVYASSAVPFATWLTKGFFDGISFELEEAALIDGASRWQSFIRILLPLSRPILLVVFILNFIGVYNDFLFPSVFLRGADKLTMATGLRSFVMGNFAVNWSVFSAASTVGSLPIMIIYLVLQNMIMSGLTQGALKG